MKMEAEFNLDEIPDEVVAKIGIKPAPQHICWPRDPLLDHHCSRRMFYSQGTSLLCACSAELNKQTDAACMW